MGWLEGDVSEKCDNCRTEYTKLYQEKEKIKRLLKEAKEELCDDCESEYGKCETKTCNRVQAFLEVL